MPKSWGQVKPAQRLLADRNVVPLNIKTDTPWKNVQLEFIDPAQSLDQAENRIKVYEDIVTKRAR